MIVLGFPFIPATAQAAAAVPGAEIGSSRNAELVVPDSAWAALAAMLAELDPQTDAPRETEQSTATGLATNGGVRRREQYGRDAHSDNRSAADITLPLVVDTVPTWPTFAVLPHSVPAAAIARVIVEASIVKAPLASAPFVQQPAPAAASGPFESKIALALPEDSPVLAGRAPIMSVRPGSPGAGELAFAVRVMEGTPQAAPPIPAPVSATIAAPAKPAAAPTADSTLAPDRLPSPAEQSAVDVTPLKPVLAAVPSEPGATPVPQVTPVETREVSGNSNSAVSRPVAPLPQFSRDPAFPAPTSSPFVVQLPKESSLAVAAEAPKTAPRTGLAPRSESPFAARIRSENPPDSEPRPATATEVVRSTLSSVKPAPSATRDDAVDAPVRATHATTLPGTKPKAVETKDDSTADPQPKNPEKQEAGKTSDAAERSEVSPPLTPDLSRAAAQPEAIGPRHEFVAAGVPMPEAVPESPASPAPKAADAPSPALQEVPDPQPAPHTVRDFSVRVSDGSSRSADIRITDRAGELRVTVRTNDATLTSNLRSDLSDLASRFDRQGVTADIWRPASTPGSASGNHSESQEQQGRGASQDGQRDDRNSNGGGGQNRQRQNAPRWLNELDSSIPFRRKHT